MADTKKYLSIVAMGPARETLLTELLTAISQRGCAIDDFRIMPVGDQTVVTILAVGNWSEIAKMESALPGLGDSLGLAIQSNTAARRPSTTDCRPYAADIVAPDQDNLLVSLSRFFNDYGVRTTELTAQTYRSSLTGAAMCSLHFTLEVPTIQHPQSLRDAFMDLCDELFADGVLDPIKH
ncbi:amino acid-binding protein [Salinisphaera sp. USBA-960]|uniref:glycine cleavage system protein R n=1 Tax=Salinisphaera orenii TaxID=856731 RepID=UPI000DBE017A|nr:amino acid-binding protein [Salifodinibacter halophilus]NNC25498.1 amino acid-binding protein [Salifodinibacter halophilus]